MNKKIFLYIFIILLIVILLFVWVLSKKNNKQNTNNGSIKTIPILEIENDTSNKIEVTPASKTEKNDVLVFNGLVKNLEIPKEINITNQEKKQIGGDQISIITKSFGIENKTSGTDQPNFEMYESSDFNESIIFDKEKNIISYSRDLFSFPLKIKKDEINEEYFKDKTRQILKNYFGLDQMDLFFKKIIYQKIEDSVFVLSNKEEADIVQLEANYMVDGYPVYSEEGFPLKIKFTRDGVLVKLTFVWPSKTQKTEISRKIKSLDEISEIPKYNFEIISINGEDEDSDITLEKLENNFSIISGNFGFLTLPKFSELVPSLILEGKSVFDSKIVYVTLAVPVFK